MRSFTVGLLGAAVVAAGVLLIRHHRPSPSTDAPPEAKPASGVSAGETRPVTLSLARLRAVGL